VLFASGIFKVTVPPSDTGEPETLKSVPLVPVATVMEELVSPALETVPKPKAVPAEFTRKTWSAVPVMSATFAVEVPELPTTERPEDWRNLALVTALLAMVRAVVLEAPRVPVTSEVKM